MRLPCFLAGIVLLAFGSMVSATGADKDKKPAAAISIPPKPQFHL